MTNVIAFRTVSLVFCFSYLLEAQIPSTRLPLAPGMDTTVANADLDGKKVDVRDYIVSAKSGQTLDIALTATRQLYFNVLPPGSQEAIVNTSVLGKDSWVGKLPVDGDYTIRVYMMRSMARRGTKAKFALRVTVPEFGGGNQVNPKLNGTKWQLVKFSSMDDTVLKPDVSSKYTVSFGEDMIAAWQIDCNRGTGTYKTNSSGLLEFGELAMTQAMCPPGSLHDKLVKNVPYVRSYKREGNRLYLSLMADGGILEFEDISPK